MRCRYQFDRETRDCSSKWTRLRQFSLQSNPSTINAVPCSRDTSRAVPTRKSYSNEERAFSPQFEWAKMRSSRFCPEAKLEAVSVATREYLVGPRDMLSMTPLRSEDRIPLRYCEIFWRAGHCLRALCAMTIGLNTIKVPPARSNEHPITLQTNSHRYRGGTVGRIERLQTTEEP